VLHDFCRNVLIAIFRAAINGFGLIEQPWSERDQSIKLLARHRRDLVKKRARLQSQIRVRLESCLPGYAGLFPERDLWDHEIGLMVLQFIAERGGTHRAVLDAGIPTITKWLKEHRCSFQSKSVERIVAWAANAASGDPMHALLTRLWQELLVDWHQKTRQILGVERELASLLAQTPWILLLSHPGINVVSAAELAGETGPIEHYASAKAITGRAGLFPSRYQSDGVDRGGKLSRFRNAKLRAAWLLVADNLNSTVSDLSFVDVEWRQHVAFFVVVVTGEFVTLQASLAVVLDAGGCGAAALAVEDLGDARAELWQRDCRGPFFSPVAIL